MDGHGRQEEDMERYVYVHLKQICAEHFEELPILINEKQLLTIFDLRYIIVKGLVKHLAEESHRSFLVHPKIRPILDEPEQVGALLYDCLQLYLKGGIQVVDPSQLCTNCTIFPRFDKDWYLESEGESDSDTIILSDNDDHESST